MKKIDDHIERKKSVPVKETLLSVYQARMLLAAWQKKQKSCVVSLDLGRSTSTVELDSDRFRFPDGEKITVDDVKKIIKHDSSVFIVEDDKLMKVQFFSPELNLYYKLCPVGPDKPTTFDISGINMHAMKETDPWTDTENKIKAVSPVKGVVLDTCSGLGYTAMFAARTAEHVITCERDPYVVELASLNPWSIELFEGISKKKIELVIMSSFDYIKECEDLQFDFIIHDPPRPNFAPELYSQEFYQEVFRALKKDGVFYHYIGTPYKSSHKRDMTQEIAEVLADFGFRDIKRVYGGLRAKR
jgi:hypothetical protein